MRIHAAIFATALLIGSAPACSKGGPANPTARASAVPTDGQKVLSGGGRFSRESRAMQACWARAALLGRPNVAGLGLRNTKGYVIRGFIEPPIAPGSPARPRLAFECAVGIDGIVTSFTSR